jgi:hypothetical protein
MMVFSGSNQKTVWDFTTIPQSKEIRRIPYIVGRLSVFKLLIN